MIVNEENKTEELKHEIYVNSNGTIYISEDDVRNLFDSTIYYDEKYNQIITTSDTKVANIAINEKKMTVNNSSVNMLDSVIRINGDIYLPVSDMAIVYNIKIDYIKETNRVIVDRLSSGIIRAIVTENTDIKFKPRGLSKDIGTLNKGETVYCFYTTSKGWRQIRTANGIIGYIKANKLGNEYIVRQDMQSRGEAIIIQRDNYDKRSFEVSDNNGIRKITLESIFSIDTENNIEISEEIDNNKSNSKIWAVITNNSIENQTNEVLKDYKSRTNLIDLIIKKATNNNVNGISIDFTNVKDKESMKRFIIEIAPKLREVGISTCIVLNENAEKQDYINIADYIVE